MSVVCYIPICDNDISCIETGLFENSTLMQNLMTEIENDFICMMTNVGMGSNILEMNIYTAQCLEEIAMKVKWSWGNTWHQ